MPLTVAAQMDHIRTIKPAGDSTFALLLEAQKRGFTLWHYTPDRLSLQNGTVTAWAEPVTVRDQVGDHVTLGEPVRLDLATVDVVLLRQDPPFDLAYITTTHLLEKLPQTTLVVNDPRSVRDCPEKLLVMDFPELMPPTLVSRDRREIEAFRAEHGDVVMKPLYGHGGANVFRVGAVDGNFGSLFDLFAGLYKEAWVTQKFLPDVEKGDKRIILVDGVAAGAVNRIPAQNDIRSNMVRGGAAAATDLTARELEICARIGPTLRDKGLIFVGIDVIGPWLTEINVTSPTGLRAITRTGGPDLSVDIWNVIERKLQDARR
ncbi:MAG: glutathione synthase [Methylobacteriaceae bacterium]|jgi:glutathione synthase|nr:glutathione synthase [Methylobacteriaceae bacterium]